LVALTLLQRQGVFPREDVPAIIETLEAPLPACFRVNPNARAASQCVIVGDDSLLHQQQTSHGHVVACYSIVGRLRDEFPALFASVEAIAPNGERVSAPR
jgi:hypothetical protein